jgi:hypothetical protein
MKISAFKRIVKEDYDEKDQPLVEKLASVFNLFQEQIYYAFNNNITIEENLNAHTATFKAKVDSNGKPIGNSQVKYTLKTKPKGAMVINVRSYDGSLLSGAPFVTYTINGEIITITQITGLLANKDYDITVVFFAT